MVSAALATGLALLVFGGATLFVAKRAFVRFDLPDGYRDVIQLMAALAGGLLLTAGILLTLLGVLWG